MASAPTGLNPPGPGNPLQRMHVTRPKSAKGRTRSNMQGFAHHVETYPRPPSPISPTSPTPRPPSARAPSGPRIGQEDIPELPYRPPSSSLNRYRVLPSIGAAGSQGEPAEADLIQQTNSMNLTTDPPAQSDPPPAKALYRSQARAMSSTSQANRNTQPTSVAESPPDQTTKLRLAIRSHCGQRFECSFHPTDTLYTVLAAAEQKTGVPYRDCILESMEIPRRSFPDLSRTLQECAIPNKSVLCIHRLQGD